MIEAVFFDVDGTLVSFHTNQIQPSALLALKQLKEQGIKVFIATGRGKDGLNVIDEFAFDAYVTMNGQYCFDAEENLIYKNSINPSDVAKVVDYVKANNVACGFSEEDRRYFNFRNHLVDELHTLTDNDNHPEGNIDDALVNDIFQIAIFIDEEAEQNLVKDLDYSISTRWYPTFCDISPEGGTKIKGIEHVCKHYGLDINNVMAFGDGGNDMTMLENVGISIAMGNAHDELKAIADYVTASVEDDGIYKALKHYQLIK